MRAILVDAYKRHAYLSTPQHENNNADALRRYTRTCQTEATINRADAPAVNVKRSPYARRKAMVPMRPNPTLSQWEYFRPEPHSWNH